jgi:hypothetical protein
MKKLVFGLALAALAAGCYTVELAKSPVLGPDVEGHVYIRNSGWSILGCIPLVCGNANMESKCGVAFFCDDTKLEIAKDKLVKLAAEKNCDIKDVTYLDDSAVIQTFGNIPIPWLVQSKLVEVSATLVKKPVEVQQNEEVAK